GLGALEDSTGIDAGLTKRIREAGSVAHQPTGFWIFALWIRRDDRISRRQIDHLGTPDEEKCVAGDEKRIGPIARKLCESRIDLTAGAGVENFELKSEGRGSRFDVSQRGGRCRCNGRIDEDGNASRSGHQLVQQFQPLCYQLGAEKIDPCEVASRPGETVDQTKSDGVLVDGEDDGDRRGSALAANAEGGPPVVAITATRRRTRSAASSGRRST